MAEELSWNRVHARERLATETGKLLTEEPSKQARMEKTNFIDIEKLNPDPARLFHPVHRDSAAGTLYPYSCCQSNRKATKTSK